MRKLILLTLIAGILAFAAIALPACTAQDGTADQYNITEEYDKVVLTGKTQSFHKEPIHEVKIKVFVNGKEQPIIAKESTGDTKEEFAEDNEIESASDGEYTAIIYLPENTAESSKIEIHIEKPTYKSRAIPIKDLTKITEGEYIHYENITPERHIGAAFYISAVVLILIYILISFEILHRTHAALLGASVLLVISYVLGHFNNDFFILSFENAKNYIDMNVIYLLMGMMLIVGIMKRTGIFQWMAFKSYQMSKGNVWKLAFILMVITAITSAFLDNVTTMLLLTPVSIEIALVLRINPWSLLMPEVLASNIGGTATLIGDPPNIMIGSYAHLAFMDFVIALAPVVFICMIALVIMMRFRYGDDYKKARLTPENVDNLLKKLEQEYKITNRALLNHSLVILIFVVILFILHGTFEMEPSIAALIGASLLMISAVVIDKINVSLMIEREIEWPTLVFFMMLFIVVGAAEETGLIQMIAQVVQSVSGGNLVMAIILIMWVSAIMSAIVDNIPFTATMLPIVAYLSQVIPDVEANILWWALALGACFGGNGTLIGASANVVTSGLAEKAGHSIKFIDFMKVGLPVMFVTMIIATLWMLFVFPRIM